MPTLLQINAVSNYGSTGKIMENIAGVAEKYGWTNYIACGSRYSQPSKYPTFIISSTRENYIAALHTLLTDRHGFALERQTKAFVKWIDTIRPDVIHLHNIHSYYLNIQVLFGYLSKKNIPVIWTLHDCWAFTGHCSHFIKINCDKWRTTCHDCALKRDFPKSLFFDKSYQNYQDKKKIFCSPCRMIITPVSKWLADMTALSFLNKYPINVVYNGIDTNVFKPVESDSLKKKYNLQKKHILLGVSNDWGIAKGLRDYFALSQIIAHDYQIVLVGMNEKQIAEYGDRGILCIPRTKSVEELVKWYSAADVVLHLSYAETFGLPVVEGFSCGTPAIVYDDTSLSELITPDTGFKITPGDLNEVRIKVEQITQQGKEHYSTNCRQRAIEKYNMRDRYMDYLKIYEKIMGVNEY